MRPLRPVHRQWGIHRGVVSLLLVCLLAGCGYRLSGNSGSSPVSGRAIAVPIFANATHRPHLETIVTTALRDEVSWRGGRLTAAADNANLVLHGKVTSFASSAVSYTADDRIREYRASLTVEASLSERETGTMLWKGTSTATQDFPVVEFPLNNPPLAERVEPQNRTALQQNSEEAAIRELSRKVARDIYERIHEGF